MKLLTITITGYIIGLLLFYLFATFKIPYWKISYFAWAKIFDAGLLMWAVLYYSSSQPVKKVVRWLYLFAFIRLAADVQSWITGIGVNNELVVAIIFVVLITLTGYLCLLPDGKAAKFLSKHLNL